MADLLAPIDAVRPMSDLPLLAFRRAICLGIDARSRWKRSCAREPRFAELAYFRGLIASAQEGSGGRRRAVSRGVRLACELARGHAPDCQRRHDGRGVPGGARVLREDAGARAVLPRRAARQTPRVELPGAVRRRARRRRRTPRASPLPGRRVLLARRQRAGDEPSRLRRGTTSRRPTRRWSTATCPSWRASSNCAATSRTRRGRSSRRPASAIPTIAKRATTCSSRSETWRAGPRLPTSPSAPPAVWTMRKRRRGRTSSASPRPRLSDARKARQIARRQQQVASAVRMRATCWFNAAVANFNLSKPDEARRYAEKVADDEQFGERARDLTARIRK